TDLGAGKALMVADRTVAPVAPARASSPAVVNTAPATVVDTTADAAPAEPVTATGNENTSDLKPGDVLLDSDNPFVTPIGSDANTIVDIPDTELEGPRTNAGSPNVPTATIQAPTAAEPAGNNALFWLAGGGIGLIAALLLFGFRRKPRFDDVPLDPAVVPKRRQTDTGEVPAMTDFEAELSGEFPAKIAEDPGIEVTHEMESHLSDDCPTEENLALDADLVIGTGLQEGASVDVAQDFGFAATTDLDLELPEEMSSGGPETRQTDIIPPLNIDTESILESEVLPDENDDDYDMSVIVDATQMPDPEDVTERDLEAVAVDTGDDDLITGDYTVSQEVDYKILEQDYEDEMTATQALNKEIARAAQELAERMDENADDTSQMTIASVTHVDVAAENDDLGDAPTVNMTDEKTIEMVPEDETIEMPSDDRTVEMPARRGKTGTKGR
ncbi:MAG: hypothetical protein KJO82_15950, partial [Gammaproteobacteria bacterium]|nr:hypothetical protein [Gammaproteobacteria bacterium]